MTSDTDVTREGKGRVHPGPSPSARTHSRLQPQGVQGGSRARIALGAFVLLLAAAASSVFGTQAHQSVCASAMAIVAAAGAFAGVLVVFGLPKARPDGVAAWLVPLIAGAGGFAFAPWLVMVNRYTDAPPGSEVLFLTTASWGAMLAIALGVLTRERISRTGGALLALAGAATLLANWERPSSFSPFVRYAAEELQMLAAGAIWVVLVLVLLRAARRGSLGVAALSAALGGLAGAGVLAAIGLLQGTLSGADFSGAGLWGYGIAIAFATAGMLMLLRADAAEAIGGAYLLVPATVSLIWLIEWAVGPLGPQPMIVDAVIGSAVITLAGVVVLWRAGGMGASSKPSSAVLPRVLWVIGVLVALASVVSAIVALVLPSMTATVSGLRTDGSQFRAVFNLLGYETAGPWLAFAAAVAGFGIAWEKHVVRGLWLRAGALVVAVGAWFVASDTPLRTLTNFIPSDVQVDYGSEFARIDFAGEPSLWVIAALAGAVVAVGITWVARAIGGAATGLPEAEETGRAPLTTDDGVGRSDEPVKTSRGDGS